MAKAQDEKIAELSRAVEGSEVMKNLDESFAKAEKRARELEAAVAREEESRRQMEETVKRLQALLTQAQVQIDGGGEVPINDLAMNEMPL